MESSQNNEEVHCSTPIEGQPVAQSSPRLRRGSLPTPTSPRSGHQRNVTELTGKDVSPLASRNKLPIDINRTVFVADEENTIPLTPHAQSIAQIQVQVQSTTQPIKTIEPRAPVTKTTQCTACLIL